MTEYYTKGLVLSRTPRRELDDTVVLYTKDLGKIVAHSKSTKKMGSKLSSHLDIGRFVKVRVIKGNNYKIVDAISEKIDISLELLKFIGFIDNMTPYELPDPHLWHGVEYISKGSLFAEGSAMPAQKIYRRFLELLGYGAEYAKCSNCEAGNLSCKVSYFHPPMLIFLCSESLKKLKINEEEVVKI